MEGPLDALKGEQVINQGLGIGRDDQDAGAQPGAQVLGQQPPRALGCTADRDGSARSRLGDALDHAFQRRVRPQQPGDGLRGHRFGQAERPL